MLYYIQNNIGRAKYTVNHYDGIQTHKDGSPFYNIAIFSNKKKMESFEKSLIVKGYKLKN